MIVLLLPAELSFPPGSTITRSRGYDALVISSLTKNIFQQSDIYIWWKLKNTYKSELLTTSKATDKCVNSTAFFGQITCFRNKSSILTKIDFFSLNVDQEITLDDGQNRFTLMLLVKDGWFWKQKHVVFFWLVCTSSKSPSMVTASLKVNIVINIAICSVENT